MLFSLKKEEMTCVYLATESEMAKISLKFTITEMAVVLEPE